MTFRNKNFVKRDYECTNVVLAIADHTPDDGMEWEPISDAQFEVAVSLTRFSPMQLLYTQRGVQYYGWL